MDWSLDFRVDKIDRGFKERDGVFVVGMLGFWIEGKKGYCF